MGGCVLFTFNRFRRVCWTNLTQFLTILLATFSLQVWAEPSDIADYAGSSNNGSGVVATVHPLATKAALAALDNGGNAIDAAVTAALTLGVVDGQNSGIGGGLFALVHWADGRVEAIDGREMAPIAAHRDMYIRDGQAVPELSRTGPLAVGIPGSVAVFEYLLNKGGQRSFADALAPGIQLASKGFPISPYLAKRMGSQANVFRQFPGTAAIFLDAKGNPWPAGHQLIQAELAKTYRGLAKNGSDYFYRGEFAQRVANWMQKNGGLITAKDFANYSMVVREPIKTTYRGLDIYGFPPPSSGGVHVAEILNILEQFDVASLPRAQRYHIVGEAMKLAFADRAYWLGDPDFVHVPKGLVAKNYGKALAAKIMPNKALANVEHGQPPEWDNDWFRRHTTNISVADKQGNWVAITTTVNTTFGSKVVVPGTGVVLNNQMDDFSAQPGVPNAFGLVGTEANSIQPGKRPLSSMSPTIIVKDGVPVMAVGAAGGPMIITQVLQAIVNYFDLHQSLYEALASPRIHQQWKPELLFVEKTVTDEDRRYLESLGHILRTMRFEGSSTAVSMSDTGRFDGVSEPRMPARNQ